MKKIWLIVLIIAVMSLMAGCVTVNVPSAIEPTENNDETAELELGDDIEDFSDEELDIVRTLQPAPQGSKVDYIIDDELFASQIDEVAYYSDEYIGKSFEMVGAWLNYEEENPTAPYAVLRQYVFEVEEDHVHEDGTVHSDDEFAEEDLFPVGLDCAYDGTAPAVDSWVRVQGVLEEYDYIDPDDGEAYPALMLRLSSVAVIPETEGGSKVVY